MLLGKRLKELRKEKGYTQQQLGDMINVTKVSICCYEKGSRTPTLDTLLDLCQVFQVGVDYFLGQDAYFIAEDDQSYGTAVAKEEIQFLEEFRKHATLYERLMEDPKRLVELIDKKLR